MSGVKEWFCLGSYRISNSIVRIFAASARFDDLVNIGVVTGPSRTDNRQYVITNSELDNRGYQSLILRMLVCVKGQRII